MWLRNKEGWKRRQEGKLEGWKEKERKTERKEGRKEEKLEVRKDGWMENKRHQGYMLNKLKALFKKRLI